MAGVWNFPIVCQGYEQFPVEELQQLHPLISTKECSWECVGDRVMPLEKKAWIGSNLLFRNSIIHNCQYLTNDLQVATCQGVETTLVRTVA